MKGQIGQGTVHERFNPPAIEFCSSHRRELWTSHKIPTQHIIVKFHNWCKVSYIFAVFFALGGQNHRVIPHLLFQRFSQNIDLPITETDHNKCENPDSGTEFQSSICSVLLEVSLVRSRGETQRSLLEGWIVYSGKLPRWVITKSAFLWIIYLTKTNSSRRSRVSLVVGWYQWQWKEWPLVQFH